MVDLIIHTIYKIIPIIYRHLSGRSRYLKYLPSGFYLLFLLCVIGSTIPLEWKKQLLEASCFVFFHLLV